MNFNIISDDIRNITKDAIVIPANPRPIIGHGVEKMI